MTETEARKKFVELAEKRVTRTLKDIQLIGNLANRSNYSYTSEDADKIIRALRKSIDDLKTKFEKHERDDLISFKL